MVNLETLSIALAQKTPPKPPGTDLAELPEPGCGRGMEGYPATPLPARPVPPTVCLLPTGPTGGPRHLLRQPLPVHRGEQEVEEPLLRGPTQLRLGPLREQTGEEHHPFAHLWWAQLQRGTPHCCGGVAMLPIIHDHLFLLRPMNGTCRPVCWSTALATRSSPPWTSTWSW